MTAAAGVRHWLSSLNLHDQYEELLLSAGYDTLEKCAQLNDALLEQIGIKPAGHRRRILLHLPRTVNNPLTASEYDSDDDDHEIYDIPPVVARKPSVVPKRESVYTNFVEMNEIPKPVLPPKKRLPSDNEVGVKLGIVSPPVKPHLPHSIFDTGSSSTDTGRAKPKLCVVYPEKRPPVPARRVSRDGKISSGTSENLLNNNIEGFEPAAMQKAPTTAAIAPVAKPRAILKHQDVLNEDDSNVDTVPVAACEFMEPVATADGYVSPVHGICSLPVDSVPKLSLQLEDASAVATSEKRLNPVLEQELQKIVSSAKKSVLRKVDLGTDSACESNGNNTIIVSSAVVQPSDNATVVSFNSDICNRTAVLEKSLISTVSDDPCRHEANVGQTSGAETDMECVYVTSDHTTSPDHQHQNKGPVVKDSVEPTDEFDYEIVDQIVSEEHIRNSSECHYPPPDFPPPPLPTGYVPSAYSKSGAGNQILTARTSTSSMSGFANFAKDHARRTELVKPQLPSRPRRYPSSADAMAEPVLTPTAAGFSSALDEHLTQKVTSPYDWLNQPAEYLDQISDVSDSSCGPFVDAHRLESVSEFTKRVSPTKQSVAQSHPACEESLLYEFPETLDAANYASMSTKTKSFHSDARSIVKPLNSKDDSKEGIRNKETGEWIQCCILCYICSVIKTA